MPEGPLNWSRCDWQAEWIVRVFFCSLRSFYLLLYFDKLEIVYYSLRCHFPCFIAFITVFMCFWCMLMVTVYVICPVTLDFFVQQRQIRPLAPYTSFKIQSIIGLILTTQPWLRLSCITSELYVVVLVLCQNYRDLFTCRWIKKMDLLLGLGC